MSEIILTKICLRKKWNSFIFIFIILHSLCLIACSEKKPYEDYEYKLTHQICVCIGLRNLSGSYNFMDEYNECTKKTADLLKTGLDEYEEDPRMTKEAYKNSLPELIQSIPLSGKCSN